MNGMEVVFGTRTTNNKTRKEAEPFEILSHMVRSVPRSFSGCQCFSYYDNKAMVSLLII